MAIGYTPTTWVDNDTLVDATRLNNIETGVQAACDELDEFYDSSTKAITAPGSVNIQELNSNINIGSSSVWIGLAAYISFLRLHSQNDAEYTVGDINDALSNALSLINYGGDIIIQNAENSNFEHGDIRLLTDGQALYNGVEIATKAKVGASSTDLNTLTSEGMYQIQNPNNAPSGVTGWVTLSVIPTSNDATYCRQMLYIPSSDDIYTRNNVGGTWGSWNKLATKSDLTKSSDISSHFTATSTAISEIEAYAIGNIIRLRMTVRPYGILNPSTWYDVLNISGYMPLSITAMEVAQGNTGNIPQTVSAILKNTGIVSLNIGTGTYTSGNYFILSSTYICS